MPDQHLLDALLDSWDRNNTILVNLLRAIPPERLATRAMEGSPSVAELFTHIHYVRLVFVQEDAPEFLKEAVPDKEWLAERDPGRIEQMLNQSARGARGRQGQAPGRPGDGSSLRPPHSPAPAHDLARGLSSRPDQAGPEAGRTPHPQ